MDTLGFTKGAKAIIELLGGLDGLISLNAYGVENWADGIMFRVNRAKLDLYVVVCIIPDRDKYTILCLHTDRTQKLKDVTVSSDQLRPTVTSLLQWDVTTI